MKKYKVARNCYGFMGRYWTEGSIVDLPNESRPPYHFELIGEKPDPEKKPDPPVVPVPAQEKPNRRDVMKPITVEVGKPVVPIGGFASSIDLAEVKQVETASQAYKRGRHKK
jgi:hypothetical protein